MEIEAPLVAKKAKPGQFIILRVNEEGERIPLTAERTARVSRFGIDGLSQPYCRCPQEEE